MELEEVVEFFLHTSLDFQAPDFSTVVFYHYKLTCLERCLKRKKLRKMSNKTNVIENLRPLFNVTVSLESPKSLIVILISLGAGAHITETIPQANI